MKQLFILLILSLTFVSPHLVEADPLSANIIRARLGIKAKDWIKPRELIQPGEKLQIFVTPLSDVFVYVIHSNYKTAQLLNWKKVHGGQLLILPESTDFYQIDGEDKKEEVTIVVIPNSHSKLDQTFRKKIVHHSQWKALQKELIEASKISLEETFPKSPRIAGALRGPSKQLDPGNLPITSGKTMVVKRYELKIDNRSSYK